MLYEWLFLFIIYILLVSGKENDVNLLQAEKMNDFKLQLRQKLDEVTHFRRALVGKQKLVPSISSHLVKIGVTESVALGTTVQVDGSDIVFLVTSSNVLSLLHNVTLVPLHGFSPYQDILSLQAVQNTSGITLVAQHTTEKFRHLVSAYSYEFNNFEMSMKKVRLHGFSLVSATKFGSQFYMTIVPKNAIFPEIRIYKLVGTQLDKVYVEEEMKMVCSGLIMWNIDGVVYIALSFVDSGILQIKKFAERPEKKLLAVQDIHIHAYVMKVYEYGGSHYLICGTRNSVKTYWWAGYQFGEMHSKSFSKEIVDVVVHNTVDSLIIAVVFHHEVDFLVLDNFSGFIHAGSQGFRPAENLNSILLWKWETYIFMLPLFKRKKPISVYEINLKFESSDDGRDDSFRNCRESLEIHFKKTEEKISEAFSKLKNVWRLSTSYKIPSLTVNGNIKSLTNSTFRSLYLKSNASLLLQLQKKNAELNNSSVFDEFSKTVLKNDTKTIRSNLYFKNLVVVNSYISTLQKHTKINDVATNRLHDALKKKGRQTFSYKTTVVNASCVNVKTDLLNERKITDYVLLKGGVWNMTGHITFGNISVNNIVTKEINNMNPKRIVLASKKQKIKGRKLFKNLKAKFIQTTGENKNMIHLEEVKEKIYRNSMDFNMPVTFISTLNIKGNLTFSSLNGSDISELHFKTVKRNDDGNISGLKVFKSMIINGSAKILEKINNFSLKNLMTVNTDQIVHRDVNFMSTTYKGDILTNSLNGLDLSSEAVVKSDPETEIKGVKILTENMIVTNITMGKDILIDSLNPSAEFSGLIFKLQNNGSKGAKQHWFNNVTVGNIEVNNINVEPKFFPILEELDNVWLKNTAQNITFLQAKNIRMNTLEAKRVCGIALEDLVTVRDDSNINAKVEFTTKVSTGSLNLKTGAYINYPNEFWNPDVKVIISDNITIEDPIFEGNLTVSEVKNFKTGLMQNETMQNVTGDVNFDTIKVKYLKAKDFNSDSVNKMNTKDIFDRSVLLSKDKIILNKIFALLKGSSIVCNGTLKNVSIHKVVTTNTKQVLKSTFRFKNSTAFKKINVTSFLNGIQLDNVVHKNNNGSISNKYFRRYTVTPHLVASGNISGVNISLLVRESFNKSVDNKLYGKILFRGNLDSNQIQINENKTIDNIYLKNLIKLNQTLKIENFNASMVKTENVTVLGSINGCALEKVLQNSLKLVQDSQIITSKAQISTLEIDGNLSVDYINGAYIPDWIVVLNSASISEIVSGVIFNDLKIKDLYISSDVNDLNVDFLLADYVSKNYSQNISGRKIFQHIAAKNLSVDSLNTNRTCSIDLSEVFETSISKNMKNKTMFSNLTMMGLQARHLSIDGNLNDLSIPYDVFLSNKSEFIHEEVNFNSSFNATKGLSVKGKIQGIQLEIFLKERVTLNATDDISAQLILEDDTYISGNCSIQGAINRIRLENIVNVLQDQQISGRKIFEEDFNITKNVTIYRDVNGLDFNFLERNTPRVSRNETFNDMVKFSTLNTSHLKCDTINGLSVTDFYNSSHSFVHHIKDILYNFTSDIQRHQELLRNLRDTVERPISLYSSFELQEVLDIKLIERFLPVYEYGVYGPKYDLQVMQMIVWVRDDDFCMRTKSHVAEVLDNGTLNFVHAEMKGKVFPFALTVRTENIIGFYVQEEYTERCSVGNKTRLVVMALQASGEKENATIPSPDNATLLEVQLLEIGDTYFLILSYSGAGPSERIFVYQYNALNNTWSSHQKFHLQDMTSLALVSVERKTDSLYEPPKVYLSVTGSSGNPGVAIYEWDFDFEEFALRTNISTSASSFSMWLDNDSTLYLLLAKDGIKKENCTRTKVFSESLEVYTLEEELVLNHTVNVQGITSLEMFSLAEEAFVLAISNILDVIYVLQFRSYNGFDIIQTIPSPNVTEARVFTVESQLYLAINSRTGLSKILKATIRGGRQGFV